MRRECITHGSYLDRAFRLDQQLREPLWPEDMYAAGGEHSTDQRPIGFDEAERTDDRDLVANDTAHEVDLLEYAVDQLGAVAPTDQDLLNLPSQPRTPKNPRNSRGR